jgi:hypothetical protein
MSLLDIHKQDQEDEINSPHLDQFMGIQLFKFMDIVKDNQSLAFPLNFSLQLII